MLDIKYYTEFTKNTEPTLSECGNFFTGGRAVIYFVIAFYSIPTCGIRYIIKLHRYLPVEIGRRQTKGLGATDGY